MSDHSAENHAFIQRQQSETLLKAGIPLSYHGRSLASVKGGQQIMDLFTNGEISRLRQTGGGLTIYGAGIEHDDLFLLTARAFMMAAGTSVVVSSPVKVLSAYADGWAEMTNKLERVSVLLLRDFQEGGVMPFTGREAALIRNLIKDRRETALPTYLHCFRSTRIEDWWGLSFATAMEQTNQEIRL